MNGRGLWIILIAVLGIYSLVSVSALSPVFFNTSIQNDSSFTYPEIVRANTALMQIVTEKKSVCKFSSAKGIPYDVMEGTFDYSLETLHKENLVSLSEGVHRLYIKCKDAGIESRELEFTFSVSAPVSAKISISDEPPLKEGTYVVTVTTSKMLMQAPTFAYSFDGSSYNPIPLAGSGVSWSGYLIINERVGEAAGSFKFIGRDFEGIVGESISSGGLFFVDTIAPEGIASIDATGRDGSVLLRWHFEEEDTTFKVYRSSQAGVSQTDFYKEVTTGDSFSDTSVDRAKTYYYRVSAVDKAGNEGDLSREVSATVLLNNASISASGLDISLHSLVDNTLTEVDALVSDIEDVQRDTSRQEGKERTLFTLIKLDKEIESAKEELESLRREVERYKTQSLSRTELEKKLSSARVKIGVIKKRVPEQLTVLAEQSSSKEATTTDIESTLLQLSPEKTIDEQRKRVEKSVEAMKGFKVKSTAYNVAIVYLDGSRKEMSVIDENIDGYVHNENYSLIWVIPKEIAQSSSEITFYRGEYTVLKDDPILSLSAGTEDVSYSIEGEMDLALLQGIKHLVLFTGTEEKEGVGLTGYFAFVDFKQNKGLTGLIAGIIIVGALGLYLYHLRTTRIRREHARALLNQIAAAKELLISQDLEGAREQYESLSAEYKRLSVSEKESVYGSLQDLYNSITFYQLQERLEYAKDNFIRLSAKERAKIVSELKSLYEYLPSNIRASIHEDYDHFFAGFS